VAGVGKHNEKGVVKAEIILLLAERDRKTSEIIRYFAQRGIRNRRGIIKHLTELEIRKIIKDDSNKPFKTVATSLLTKGQMKKELIYSINNEDSESVYRILNFIEGVGIAYLKVLMRTTFFQNQINSLSEEIKGFLSAFKKNNSLKQFLDYWQDDSSEFSLNNETLDLYKRIYKKFCSSRETMIRVFTNVSSTFPGAARYLFSALSSMEKIGDDKQIENREDFLNALNVIMPDEYIMEIYKKNKRVNLGLLFLTSVIIKIMADINPLEAVIQDSQLSHLTSNLIGNGVQLEKLMRVKVIDDETAIKDAIFITHNSAVNDDMEKSTARAVRKRKVNYPAMEDNTEDKYK